MKRYLNALLYGNRETKRYLWSVLVGCLLTVFLLVGAVWRGSIMVGGIAFVIAIVTLLIWQSKDLKNTVLNRAEPREISGRKSDADTGQSDAEESGYGHEGVPTEEEERETDPRKRHKVRLIDYEKYDNETLKQTLHHYRVKKTHKTIIIDSCPSQGIRECPAYVWRDRKYAYFLLLEAEPRRIRYPLSAVMRMEYRRGVLAKPEEEYLSFLKKSLVTTVFWPHLPSYYQVRRNGVVRTQKNLYVLAGDLAVTNSSARNVIEMLSPAFRMEDEVTRDSRHGDLFVAVYQQNVLLRDGVLDVKEYQDRIKPILQDLAQAEMEFDAFRKSLERMVEYRLITDEFADYFVDYRRKWQESKKKG